MYTLVIHLPTCADQQLVRAFAAEATAHIRLRAATTKAKRGDQLALHPEPADELRRFKPKTAKACDRVFRTVPDMKAFKADLALAGIPYEDAQGRYFDFHAIRKSLSTHMAVNGMSQRVRQSHMRHTNPKLTGNTYMDEAHLLEPVARELSALPPIDESIATGTSANETEAIPAHPSEDAENGSALVARVAPKERTGGSAEHVPTTDDIESQHAGTWQSCLSSSQK